jgi:hypothetical protein
LPQRERPRRRLHISFSAHPPVEGIEIGARKWTRIFHFFKISPQDLERPFRAETTLDLPPAE